MQLTNNTTTVHLNEEKLLNLIIDQRIVKLEQIFEDMYQVNFRSLPTRAINAYLYLCVVELGLKAGEVMDVYQITSSELTRVLKACHTKMLVNEAYKEYLNKIHTKCIKSKIAA